jgi:putative membrane protein
MVFGADVLPGSPWRFQAHPEVWALVLGLAAMYWYAVTRIGPRAIRPGEHVVTRGNVAWFAAALAVLWLASDWPVHDMAEEYLYSVHMAQHMVYIFVLAPMVLLGTPTWLARLVIGQGRVYGLLKRIVRPVPATLLYTAVTLFTHWPAVVNASAANGPLHYIVHVLVVTSALILWLPICGPLHELRFSLGVQMVYLFLQSIVPTVPAGWLTFADSIVYKHYDVLPRVWGLPATYDQQIAGLLMKIGGGLFLWTVIAILFVRFATKSLEDDRATGAPLDRRAPVGRTASGDVLTWEQVQRQLAEAPPAPVERTP